MFRGHHVGGILALSLLLMTTRQLKPQQTTRQPDNRTTRQPNNQTVAILWILRILQAVLRGHHVGGIRLRGHLVGGIMFRGHHVGGILALSLLLMTTRQLKPQQTTRKPDNRTTRQPNNQTVAILWIL